MAKILITGGSGLIGKAITRQLLETGHEVTWLSRHPGNKNGVTMFGWDPAKGYLDAKAFEGVDHLIHLAGANIIGRRWTEKYKKTIIASRVKTSELLCNCIRDHKVQLKSFTGACAVGYYGAVSGERVFTEGDAPGNDFLAGVCVAWEKSYDCFVSAGIRTAIFRNAVVLQCNEGALRKMKLPFKLGLGAVVASGHQYMPWIHIDDLAAMYVRSCFDESLSGVYNAVAPQHITNKQFSGAFAESLGKPLWLPNIPAFVLKLIFGEAAETICEGSKVGSEKIRSLGFEFRYPTISEALQILNC